ncbi:MAG TPA: hypothetical protein VMV77_09300 [Bacteroidales bacterium]|nr:hypothetical protein [Bacteroidales bacterium]
MSLSTGLIAAYNKQLTGSSWIDLTGHGNDIPLTSTTWEDNGLLANASGEIGLLANVGNAIISPNVGTIIIQFTSLSAFADASTRVLFGRFGGSHILGNVNIFKHSASTLYLSLRDDLALHYLAYNVGKLPTWQTGVNIGFSWDRSNILFDTKKMVCNINGVNTIADSSGGADGWNDFAVVNSLGVLNDVGDTTKPAYGSSNNLYIFNTTKTEAEFTAINANHNIILQDYRKVAGNYNIPIIF